MLAVLALIAALLMILVCFLGWNTRTCARVSPDYEYFLLVRPCEESTSAAVVEESYSAGGAAVMYGGDKVVLACYFSRSDAERVCAQTRAEGTEAEVVRIAASEFFLYGRNAAYADRAAANAAAIPASVRTASSIAARVRTLFKKSNAAFSPDFSRVWANIGIIADDSAPSPSSLRKRLGRVKAKVYAALTADRPRKAIVAASRANPSAREPTVAEDIFIMFFSGPAMIFRPCCAAGKGMSILLPAERGADFAFAAGLKRGCEAECPAREEASWKIAV